ncbi:hypothetical protein SL1157_2246 [Ruegeria lacuscaerulensis ITI-1157]|nr:hypothetical protein SL1157_2246 [Ruegeria lacuscaerulensis ITI-1157]
MKTGADLSRFDDVPWIAAIASKEMNGFNDRAAFLVGRGRS